MHPTPNPRKLVTGAALAAALAALSWFTAAAADKPTAPPPGKAPSRIILTWAGDPARTQAVTWRTETPLENPQAQIAPLTAKPKFQDTTRTVKGTLSPSFENTAAHYRVEFQDLQPGTRYAYRVGDGSAWSEWNVFQTASTRPDPFRFIYIGDAQNDIYSLWSRTIRMAFATAPDARFIAHAGDLVGDGFDDRLWGEWCQALSFISAMVPSLPVPGNHDLHPAPNSTDANNPLVTPATWNRHFDLPLNGPKALPGQSYFVDFQGVRFIALDVNAFGGTIKPDSDKERVAVEEVAWLEKVLGDNPNHWTVVLSHYPVYPIAKQRSRFVEMESRLVPLYDKYHVDLVLQGHDHSYGRTYKLRGGKVVPDVEPGTVYTVSVSGPKMYEVAPQNPELFAKTLQGSQMFQVVSVSQERLTFHAYAVDGTLIDSFDLRKELPSPHGTQR